jgi:hypothetical protein
MWMWMRPLSSGHGCYSRLRLFVRAGILKPFVGVYLT